MVDALCPVPCVVRRVRAEYPGTVTLTVARADGAPVPFEPGQFTMLYVFGVGEVPISISGDPDHPDELVHTVRAVGAVTRAIGRLEPGAIVGLRGPFGTAWPLAAATGHDVVIVAGGIGLAAVRAALHHVLGHRDQYGRLVLLYGARTPRDVLYARELRDLRKRVDLDVALTVDRAPQRWEGSVGVVTRLVQRAGFDAGRAMAFVCGPEAMMRFAAQALERRGVADGNIYVSLERSMKCGVARCGRCQLGPLLVCRDGPIVSFARVKAVLNRREV